MDDLIKFLMDRMFPGNFDLNFKKNKCAYENYCINSTITHKELYSHPKDKNKNKDYSGDLHNNKYNLILGFVGYYLSTRSLINNSTDLARILIDKYFSQSQIQKLNKYGLKKTFGFLKEDMLQKEENIIGMIFIVLDPKTFDNQIICKYFSNEKSTCKEITNYEVAKRLFEFFMLREDNKRLTIVLRQKFDEHKMTKQGFSDNVVKAKIEITTDYLNQTQKKQFKEEYETKRNNSLRSERLKKI